MTDTDYVALPKLDAPMTIAGIELRQLLPVVCSVIYFDLGARLLAALAAGPDVRGFGRPAPIPVWAYLAVGAAVFLLTAVPLRGETAGGWLRALLHFVGTPRRTIWRPDGPPEDALPRVGQESRPWWLRALRWLAWLLSFLPVPTPGWWARHPSRDGDFGERDLVKDRRPRPVRSTAR